MPSTFHALPLARRGESFLLETGAKDTVSILVDAGRELSQSPKQISQKGSVVSDDTLVDAEGVLTMDTGGNRGGAVNRLGPMFPRSLLFVPDALFFVSERHRLNNPILKEHRPLHAPGNV